MPSSYTRCPTTRAARASCEATRPPSWCAPLGVGGGRGGAKAVQVPQVFSCHAPRPETSHPAPRSLARGHRATQLPPQPAALQMLPNAPHAMPRVQPHTPQTRSTHAPHPYTRHTRHATHTPCHTHIHTHRPQEYAPLLRADIEAESSYAWAAPSPELAPAVAAVLASVQNRWVGRAGGGGGGGWECQPKLNQTELSEYSTKPN